MLTSVEDYIMLDSDTSPGNDLQTSVHCIALRLYLSAQMLFDMLSSESSLEPLDLDTGCNTRLSAEETFSAPPFPRPLIVYWLCLAENIQKTPLSQFWSCAFCSHPALKVLSQAYISLAVLLIKMCIKSHLSLMIS